MTIKVVYIASPYTLGDVAANVAEQMRVAHLLLDLGFCPISPLLTHFLHIYRQRPYEEWMAMDMTLLRRADAVLRLPGESPGADREVEEAKREGIPTFFDTDELVEAVLSNI